MTKKSPNTKKADANASSYANWLSDDICFCKDECDNTKCFRHPSNIRMKDIPHAFSFFKGTSICPSYKEKNKE